MFLQRALMSAVGLAAIGVMSFAVADAAQRPGYGWHHDWEHWGPMYGTRTEIRVTGTVEAVNTVSGPDDGGCCGVGGGTHVALKTTTESIDAHLGPTTWLRELGVNLTAGDVVEIVGWRVTMRGTPVLVAREITKGATTWTLRTSQGRWGPGPCWR
jgi:hypothetical protein